MWGFKEMCRRRHSSLLRSGAFFVRGILCICFFFPAHSMSGPLVKICYSKKPPCYKCNWLLLVCFGFFNQHVDFWCPWWWSSRGHPVLLFPAVPFRPRAPLWDVTSFGPKNLGALSALTSMGKDADWSGGFGWTWICFINRLLFKFFYIFFSAKMKDSEK